MPSSIRLAVVRADNERTPVLDFSSSRKAFGDVSCAITSLCGVLHAPLLHAALLRLDFCERDAEGKCPIPTKVR